MLKHYFIQLFFKFYSRQSDRVWKTFTKNWQQCCFCWYFNSNVLLFNKIHFYCWVHPLSHAQLKIFIFSFIELYHCNPVSAQSWLILTLLLYLLLASANNSPFFSLLQEIYIRLCATINFLGAVLSHIVNLPTWRQLLKEHYSTNRHLWNNSFF